MPKIYLSPSSQTENKYKVGNTNEAEQCRAIADLCLVALERCGFEAMTNKTGDMYARVRESNEWGADAHIPIHTNAHNGKVAGFRGFFQKIGNVGHKIISAIMAKVAPLTPGTSDGVSAQPDLYEIKATNAPCAYLELGFHDNATEAQYIIDHKEELAEAICKGVCAHFGVEYVSPNKTEIKTETKGENTVNVTLNVLQKGAKGEQVKALQRMLCAMGYSLGAKKPVDGDFGTKTDAAVRAYQKKNGLTVDGIVGEKTWNKLLKG